MDAGGIEEGKEEVVRSQLNERTERVRRTARSPAKERELKTQRGSEDNKYAAAVVVVVMAISHG